VVQRRQFFGRGLNGIQDGGDQPVNRKPAVGCRT